jgi:hypothetical protein
VGHVAALCTALFAVVGFEIYAAHLCSLTLILLTLTGWPPAC